MRYAEAKKRNALPVPAGQYGGAPGGIYNYWDQLDLNALKPAGANFAEITLLYQGTSWEYIQFLYKANKGTNPEDGGNAFLGAEGVFMLEAWINAEVPDAIEVEGDRRMVPPIVMATVTWPPTDPPVDPPPGDDDQVGVASIVTGILSGKGKNKVFTELSSFNQGDTIVIRSTVLDEHEVPVSNATVTTTITGPETTTVTAISDANGLAEASWKTTAPNRKGAGGTEPGNYTATTTAVVADDFVWDGVATNVVFSIAGSGN